MASITVEDNNDSDEQQQQQQQQQEQIGGMYDQYGRVNLLSVADTTDATTENNDSNINNGDRNNQCNLIALYPFTTTTTVPTVPTATETSTNHQITEIQMIYDGYTNAFATILAVQHLNTGNGIIIKEISGLNETCKIKFNLDFIDTHKDPKLTIMELLKGNKNVDYSSSSSSSSSFEYTTTTTDASSESDTDTDVNGNGNDNDNDNVDESKFGSDSDIQQQLQLQLRQRQRQRQQRLKKPCIFLGAHKSKVTASVSTIMNNYGYPQISGYGDTDTFLDDNEQFPLLSRTIPSNVGITKAFISYLIEKRIQHLVVINMSNSDYVVNLYNFAQHNNVTIKGINLNEDISNIDSVMNRVKKTQYKYILFVTSSDFTSYEKVLNIAVQNDVAGTGEHTWYFHTLLPPTLLKSIPKNNSNLEKALIGSGIFNAVGGYVSNPLYDKYINAIQDMVKSIPTTNDVIHHIQSMNQLNLSSLNNNQYNHNDLTTSIVTDANANAGAATYYLLKILEDDNSTFFQPSESRGWGLSSFTYEATILAGLAVCNAAATITATITADDAITNTNTNTTTTLLYLNGTEFQEEVRNVHFKGITGDVILDPKTGTRRADSTYYAMRNLVAIDIDTTASDNNQDNDTNNGNGNSTVNFILVPTDRLSYDNNDNDKENWTIIHPYIYNNGKTMVLNDLPPPLESTPDIPNLPMRIIAYMFCGFCIISAICLGIWTIWNRNTRIVRASQPFYLLVICCGVIMLATSIIPMTISIKNHASGADNIEIDNIESNLILDLRNDETLFMSRACTSVLWLCSTGIAIIFSALYSKARRINKIMYFAKRCKRISVKVKDTIAPMIAFVILNIIILSLMTIFHPFTYRVHIKSWDIFHRPDITEGRCYHGMDQAYYLAPLAILHGIILFLAIQQLWVSRDLSTEFQESSHVFKSLLMILLVLFIGLPVLLLTRGNGNANLFTTSAITFVMCTSILGLMFIPKIRYEQHRKSQSDITVGGIGGGGGGGGGGNGDVGATSSNINIDEDDDTEYNELILSTSNREELIVNNAKLNSDNDKLRKQIHDMQEQQQEEN